MILGIDHGYYAIKTRNCSFPAGITPCGSQEPYTRQNVLTFSGCFFVCGSGRQPIQRDKTANDNYYLLTLAAIAQELQARGAPRECNVTIAAGLPLTSYGREKPAFRKYLLRNAGQLTEFDYEGKVVEYLGANADRNRPWGNRVVIHKTDSETGQVIAADAKFTLYEWNAARGVYEVSTNYAIERAVDGSYTVACLHPDWTLAEARTLYFEDTLCDARADTANHDGTTSMHEVFYSENNLSNYPNGRAFTNDGQFLIVETQAPAGYFGDWTDVTQPGASGSDLGKRAYYLRLTGDGSTITLDNAAYNADILTENQGGVLVETPDGTVTVQIYDKPKGVGRHYVTDSTGLANNEDAYTSVPVSGKFTNDRVIGEIFLAKADLDQLKESVPRALTDEDGDNTLACCLAMPALAAGDPLAVIDNLNTFIFSIIRAVGLILLGWGIVQVGLSLQSHDPSQRSQGFLTLAGGIIITFAREILDLIIGTGA